MARVGDLWGDTIVLIGRFNAGILQPSWFDSQGLLEGRGLKVRKDQILIAPPIAVMNLGWLAIQVTDDQAHFATTDEASSAGPLRDFVVDLLRVLEHTPVFSMGMNHAVHFDAGADRWARLVGALGPSTPLDPVLPNAAPTTVQWQAPRTDEERGHINLTLQPSARIEHGGYLQWNSHVELAGPDETGGARRAVEVLQARWDEDRRAATEAFSFMREIR